MMCLLFGNSKHEVTVLLSHSVTVRQSFQIKEALMSAGLEIIDVYAREIMDSRGNPTVEAEVTIENAENGETI